MFSFTAFKDGKYLNTCLWTSILKIKWQNQNLELIITMSLGLNASDSESMCFMFDKLLKDDGERVWDKWYASKSPFQRRKEPFACIRWSMW